MLQISIDIIGHVKGMTKSMVGRFSTARTEVHHWTSS